MNLKRSENIRERLIECSENGELSMPDELQITQYLFNRLNLLPLAEAARKEGISFNGMKQRVKAGSEMHLKAGGQVFVVSTNNQESKP